MTKPTQLRSVAVIGGGAAGYFAAIACAEADPHARVVILEGTRRPLTKVRISGGGRCNVTHNCFDPLALVKHYPRGHKELLGPFNRFQPKDTIAWFQRRGVEIKTEDDGRMFPITDDSETIAGCLEQSAQKAGVEVRLGVIVKDVHRDEAGHFILGLRDGDESFSRVILATGSAPHGHRFAGALGHLLVPPVPSLFTFNVVDPRLAELAGISFPLVSLTLTVDGGPKPARFSQTGPLLITHWGLSGPAVLKLSAWAARELHASNYRANLTIQFLKDKKPEAVLEVLRQFKLDHPRKSVGTEAPLAVPKRYWQRLVALYVKSSDLPWADLGKEPMQKLSAELCGASFQIQGKGVFKEEFVTAGGVTLKEVDFRTMESRRSPGLYFAGEILDIDGITGGFNFQNAWTTGWIAGQSAAASLLSLPI